MTDDVSLPTPTVRRMREARSLPSALMGGSKAMRAAGRTYLPQESAESNAAYEVRLERSFLFNGYRKTVRDMASKVFSRPVVVQDDMPERLARYAEDIDLSGRNLDQFGFEVFVHGLSAGITYILVDADKPILNEDGSQATLTEAQAAEMNRRPWMVHIKPRQVLGWKSEMIAGIETLTQFRFTEVVTDPAGEFGEEEVEQIKVFDRMDGRVSWRAFRMQKDTGKWVEVDNGSVSIPEIAVVPVYFNRTGFMAGEPVLADLAEVNLSHWQSQSDQRNILHVSRVPILFGAGFDDHGGKIEIGASRMITNSNVDAKLAFVEHSGAAIASGRQDLKDLEFQMQTMGLELLIPRPSETATGEAIDQARMNTPLAMMAMAEKDALEKAFEFMAMYDGVEGSGSLTINTDYGVSLRGAQDISALAAFVDAKIISRELAITEAKRRGFLSEDVIADEEVQRALTESFPADDDEEDGGTFGP